MYAMGALAKPAVAWGRRAIAVSDQSMSSGGRMIQVMEVKGLLLLDDNTLEDSDANIMGELEDGFSRAIAEAEDDAIAAGAGDDNPKGIVSDTLVQANYEASGVAAALSDSTNNGIDAFIKAYYKPKKVYRRNGTWAMNSNTEEEVRKLKDGNGQYLWQPNVQAGAPATLLGRAIVNAEGMPDIAAGAYPIAFGDFFAGYKLVDRKGITVQRLVEKYAEYGQTGILVKKRVGGMVVLPEAFSCIKIAAS
jgi:HK97 family phage major capsid protein